MSTIEALYIFDEHNNLLLDHVYNSRPSAPPPPSVLLPLYLQQPAPRPSLSYLSSFSPPIFLYASIHDNLLFLSPTVDADIDPLLVLEFLHRVADALEEFLGTPLLASKITGSYDVVAQILAEMADAGIVCQSEANALRDVIETGPGVLNKLLGSLAASGSGQALRAAGGKVGAGLSSSSAAQGLVRPPLPPSMSSQGSAIPWRRSNVRHTSNELYVDFVESLAVTIAPSGRPLSAFAHGSIAFTCKVSGVPDLTLTLSTGGKGAGMGGRAEQLGRVMERAVFHPCVRLNRWKNEGVLSFVPPDGRFALCGYETDLLGPDPPLTATAAKSTPHNLNIPAMLEVNTSLGPHGADFEVRIKPSLGVTNSTAAASLQSHLSNTPFRTATPLSHSDGKSPTVDKISVVIPIPPAVRNITDLHPTKGEALFNPADGKVEWNVPAKDFEHNGAVLRCTVQGPPSDDLSDGQPASGVMNGLTATTYDYYDDDQQSQAYQSPQEESSAGASAGPGSANGAAAELRREDKMRELMPSSATLSFSVKGWLASGLRVESLLVDTQRSRGVGPDIRPYKGVKYLTVSRQGVEVRC